MILLRFVSIFESLDGDPGFDAVRWIEFAA
jgi:hypothetical protein